MCDKTLFRYNFCSLTFISFEGSNRYFDEVNDVPPPPPSINVTTKSMKGAIRKMDKESTPRNTMNNYKTKIQEFKLFCNWKYDSVADENFRHLVDGEKVYTFMYYQAMRNKRKTGGKNKKEEIKFDPQDYISVVNRAENLANTNNFSDPNDPLGFSQLNIYRAALYNLHDEQRSNGKNPYNWQTVWGRDCVLLFKHIKARKPRINRKQYNEKLQTPFSPYSCVEDVTHIESELWNLGQDGNQKIGYASIRNRFVFLFTLSGILRCESVYRAEWCHMFNVIISPPSDPHDMNVMFLQMEDGTLYFITIFVLISFYLTHFML